MGSKGNAERSFKAKLEGSEKGRAFVVLPFDPEKVWGRRPRYHIRGTVNGAPVRGPLEKFERGYFLALGPAYRRDSGLQLGDSVAVTLEPEGPQREALAEDIVAALADEPEAAQFFDGLATFYRKNYLRWIDATKRSPEVRAQRIAELVELMKAGRKQRPR
ncbi:MAG TPA: YdeI/OmpD-associated family protein [Bryobacteraceae bacterium]|nr:YdeI/OmpD-associated family protein [Bryobacteraceae bacterium]